MIWPMIKKYGKYVAILLAGAALVVLYVMVRSWLKKKKKSDDGLTEGTEKLKDVISEIGSKMSEANQQATVEIAVSRGEEKATKKELESIVKIKDPVKRRERLAELYNRVSS